MTRKMTIFGLVAALALVAFGAVVAGTTMAQRAGQFDRIRAAQEGDTDIVATVQGREVTRGEIRRAADYWMEADGTLTKTAATQRTIVPVINGHIVQAEVERRGLIPTEDEAREYMRPHKEACLGANGQECRDHLERMDFDLDTYWEEVALAEYQEDLGDIRLHQAIFAEMGLQDATNEELLVATDAIEADLRDNATIVWHDAELERQYRQALTQ